MIRTTKIIAEAAALTHGGVFHADEVFASVILSYTTDDFVVARVFRVPQECEKLVYDIGGGKYDHHQSDKEYRTNGLPYAAAGLIWRDFGTEALAQMGVEEEIRADVWAQIDDALIIGIDALDNGVALEGKYDFISVSEIIGSYNPLWDEDRDADEAFLDACAIADQIFRRLVYQKASEMRGKEYVKKAMKQASGRIVLLDRFVPWQRCVCTEDPEERFWYIVYPSNRGGYNVQCVPDAPDSFGMRHALPEEWRGLGKEELREITGVEDAMFVHPAGFIGGADSLEGALRMAEKAVAI